MTKQKLRESLNKRDLYALNNCTKYYDLVALYEAAKYDMKDEDYKKLESFIIKDNDEQASSFLSSFLTEDFIKEEQGQLDNSELNLDRIFESEMLQETENPHKINVEKCYAKASGNPYYSLKDVKTGEFIGKKQRVSYKTKEKAKEKLHDMKSGQDDSYIDYSSGLIITDESIDAKTNLTEGEIRKGPFEVTVYMDYSKGKLRAKADGGFGRAQVAFPNHLRTADGAKYSVSELSWNGKNYTIPKGCTITPIKDTPEVKPEVAPEIPEKTPERTTGKHKVSLDFFDENLMTESNVDFGETILFGKEKIDPNKISPEGLAMVLNPLKSSGEPWDQTKCLLRLYDDIFNLTDEQLNERKIRFVSTGTKKGILREDLLLESGSPSYNRIGDHSTWFDDFKDLDLAFLRDNYVFAGVNLKDWIEGNCPTVYLDGAGNPIKNRKDKKYGIYRTSGNPEGIDLREYTSKVYGTREDQGLQPDRSHGRGDTKLKPGEAPTPKKAVKKAKKKISLDFFDEALEEEINDYNIQEIIAKKAEYRQLAGLAEDIKLTEDNINKYDLKTLCCKHGWDEDDVKSELLSEIGE